MDLIAIGKIRTSHGIKGFVKVVSFSGETDHFYDLEKIILKSDRQERESVIEEVKPLGDSVILKIAGIDSPEKAKTLAGMEILVPRDNAAPLNEGEYYHADLVQCSLRYDGEIIGRVKSIIEGGGGELFEVELNSGESVLIPFRDEFIGDISIDGKLIELKEKWILG
ncbi:ribosome maturation factor RimM [Spirochaeta isovalerica]|uniref:Ribosome maturation factor RimM n=1 Tax=Spirochaeta isovalerica TaxID=150 RepID=A0A841R9I4_9SPIO|nr:ribosome maturation factor RimM [Spirochaeta isovalerica]MBB6479122.1 16S rRNA processing protein RimM [Spirochaeta isovalerica]